MVPLRSGTGVSIAQVFRQGQNTNANEQVGHSVGSYFTFTTYPDE
jgi:hypothetical protein